MTTPSTEQVLCTPTSYLPSHWLPTEGALPLEPDAWAKAMNRLPGIWLPRSIAESDLSAKQWIPYALLLNPCGALAAYPRQGAEARLHGLWSLGLGGHINPGDASPGFDGGPAWTEVVERGLRRELAEEFPGTHQQPLRFLGLIHESRSAVGRVHLGAVFVVLLEHDPGEPAAELTGLRWIPRQELGTTSWPLQRFELWSQLALQLLPHPLP